MNPYMPLLEVDLTHGEIRPVEVPEDIRRRWIGGTGLGLYLLSQELRRGLRPTDPDCPVFILGGPLTGTVVPSSSDCSLTTLNADLPHHLCTSHAHAFFGARLRQAGWDGIILRGAADAPSYIWIDGTSVEIRSAAALWRLDTFETVRRLRPPSNSGERVSVACIGPAGESRVWGASVRVDEFSGFNHGGAGVIWGAKNLKAIVVRGGREGSVPIHDPEGLKSVAERITSAIKDKGDNVPRWPFGRQHLASLPDPLEGLPEQARGLTMIPLLAELGTVPGKNFTDTSIGVRWGRQLNDELRKWKVEPVASWNCEIACHHRTTCTTGPLAGAVVTGFAGETMEEVGPNLGIQDPGVAFAVSGVVDGYGMAATSAPRVIAMLMEAFNEGEIGLAETGGTDLTWGNYEAVLQLLELTVERQGLGDLIAKGLRETAHVLGIEHRAVHMKWAGFQDYEQRATPIFLFQSQIASGAGPTGQMYVELGFGTTTDPDLGIREVLDPRDLSYIADVTYKSQLRKMWEDCIGLCQFAGAALKDELQLETEAVKAATGQQYSGADALVVGERVVNLQRLIQLYLGFSPEEDFTIAKRLLEKLDSGPAAGVGITAAELRQARDQFYECTGFSTETGAPGEAVLARLGLSTLTVGRA